ncbi:CDGSH iron-sulfur domain-containing protein 2 homolog [Cimex lectularius]|uniref:Iron-binding zinc finger CDGSH type domain-containing protein n=1 Tax=Cimex lectularius TaxID=79782 RepID=A0A8I6RMF4_CIMLE|nr:CDGSH iron-sulfur domain-containing protein 2 homolog [Cimex lectularius]
MEPLSNLVTVHLPHYLQGLPLPKSVGGWFRLGVKDWASLVPFFAVVGGLSYTAYRAVKPRLVVNPSVQKHEAKVVHIANIEDLGDSTAYCRCWRSKKFPYCDGSHGAHNAETGDNVGPVVVKKK